MFAIMSDGLAILDPEPLKRWDHAEFGSPNELRSA